MSIESAPFYWLECDAEGCEERYPGDGDDVMAYGDERSLIELAPDSDWLIVNGKHFCEMHGLWHCGECGAALTEDEQDVGEYQCFKCAPDLAEATP